MSNIPCIIQVSITGITKLSHPIISTTQFSHNIGILSFPIYLSSSHLIEIICAIIVFRIYVLYFGRSKSCHLNNTLSSRSCLVILSIAKDLTHRATRSFAELSMTNRRCSYKTQVAYSMQRHHLTYLYPFGSYHFTLYKIMLICINEKIQSGFLRECFYIKRRYSGNSTRRATRAQTSATNTAQLS